MKKRICSLQSAFFSDIMRRKISYMEEKMNKKEKYGQIRKEAIACFWALLAIIAFWAIAGIGVSQLNITIFHTPMWAITGCIGTWIFSVVLVIWLVKHVFKDFSLDDEEEPLKKEGADER